MADLSHMDSSGAARMVDVSGKPVTLRRATARGFVEMSPALVEAIRSNSLKKGDLLATARIAGIQGGKLTSTLIPLCHPLPLNQLTVDLTVEDGGVAIAATAVTEGKTGVEMEALTAVSVAALTIVDMGKAVDPHMTIAGVTVTSKAGGKRDFSTTDEHR